MSRIRLRLGLCLWLLMGAALRAAEPAEPADAADTAQVAEEPRFEIRAYEVHGDHVLGETVLAEVLRPFLGTNMAVANILQAASKLQMEYWTRGFRTVVVQVPEQQITNAMVRIEVMERPVADIEVLNNRHFSSNNVRRALPGLKPGAVLQSALFQAELDRANANRDRQILPEVRPGFETNSSILILDVKDRLPLHGRLDFNNASTPGSPDHRLNANLSYDNLWQREHSFGLQYGFSTEETKPESVPGFPMNPLDAPRVAFYSAFYRAPLLGTPAVAEEVAAEPGRFGFNEATRRFEAPPAAGRAELSAYATRSTTDLVIRSPIETVVDTPLLKIESQQAVRNVTQDHQAGLRISAPAASTGPLRSSFSFGFDVKDHAGGMYPSNIFYTTATITNDSGATVERKDTTVVPGRGGELNYAYGVVALGVNSSMADKGGSTSGGLSWVFGPGEPFANADDIAAATYSDDANGRFIAVRLRLSREQKLPARLLLVVNAEGQVASGPLVSLEQFGIGGLGSVRGYQEGELYGDHGWYTQFELRSPTFAKVDTIDGHPIGLGLTLSVFTDYGQVYLAEAQGRDPNPNLWGTGFGANVSVGRHFQGQAACSWALIDSPSGNAGATPRVTFAIGAQF